MKGRGFDSGWGGGGGGGSEREEDRGRREMGGQAWSVLMQEG